MGTGYTFPLRPRGRYLADASGKPFFFQGDTLWMFGNIRAPEEGLLRYLDHRLAMGFSVIQMMTAWKAGTASGDCLTGTDWAGNLPFVGKAAEHLWRLDLPNEAYFRNLKWFAEQCADRGLLLLIAPLWVGAGLQGFSRDMAANSVNACHAYGRYLGQLLGDLPNVGWIHGGDKVPIEAERLRCRSIMDGIKGVASTPQLHTAHWRRPAEASLSREVSGFEDLDLELVYSASLTYYGCLRNWQNDLRKPAIPAFMGESYYEGQTRFDLDGDGQVDPWPRHMCRRQAYWSVLSGAGHTYGVEREMGNVFHAPTPENLDLPGTADMRRVTALFTKPGRRWYDLVPDCSHQVITAGYGTPATDSIAAHQDNDYVTCARTPDGALVMAYLPPTGTATRSIKVDMSKLRRQVFAQWFNPASGEYTRIAEYPGQGCITFTTPGNNGTGQNDWVLLLES